MICLDEDFDTRLAKAAKLLAAGDAETALRAAETALVGAPRPVDALRVAASCHSALGHHGAAGDAYARLIELQPDDAASWIGLATSRIADGGEIDPTTHQVVIRLLGQFPFGPDIAQLMATVELHAGRLGEAMGVIERAEQGFGRTRPLIELEAAIRRLDGDELGAIRVLQRWCDTHLADVSALIILADYLSDAGDFPAAAAMAAKASLLRPNDGAIACQLGKALLAGGDKRAAATVLRRALELDPSDPAGAAHALAVAEGRVPARLAAGTVRATFEAFAGYYDRKMVDRLGYRGPEVLRAALEAEAGTALPARWDILDLGCGTGLVGAALAHRRDWLVGIDLSARMLERARRLALYDRLIEGELVAALGQEDAARYDVAAAGEVFIYFGDLSPLLNSVRRVLRPGGYLVFNTDCAAYREGDFVPRPSRSFAHSEAYLARAAAATGFELRRCEPCFIRSERHHALDSRVLVLRAAPAPDRRQ